MLDRALEDGHEADLVGAVEFVKLGAGVEQQHFLYGLDALVEASVLLRQILPHPPGYPDEQRVGGFDLRWAWQGAFRPVSELVVWPGVLADAVVFLRGQAKAPDGVWAAGAIHGSS